ncbi:hypothetical protein D3C72_1404310 [compost metagenome]
MRSSTLFWRANSAAARCWRSVIERNSQFHSRVPSKRKRMLKNFSARCKPGLAAMAAISAGVMGWPGGGSTRWLPSSSLASKP